MAPRVDPRPATAPPGARMPSLTPREREVRAALDAVRSRCDVRSRLAHDPVSIVHRYADPHDRELVALVAACVAFGNVKAVRAKLEDLLSRIGERPALRADDPSDLRARLDGWKHRVFRGDDVARLLAGARAVQRERGSLGASFEERLRERGDLRTALAEWCEAVRSAGGLARGGARRGPSHLLPDVLGSSGCKRLLLFLRWMGRPADGVDLGAWKIDPARLLIPVDVHVHKLARNLGLTHRRSPTWRTAEEITGALARFDPADPTKYDFSLCHLGMLQRCPSRRDARRCEGCGVRPVCIHWRAGGDRRGERSAQATRSGEADRGGRRPGGGSGKRRARPDRKPS